MKVSYRIDEDTLYEEAMQDKDLHGWIKAWSAIQHKYSGLGVVHLNLDKRNYKKVNPFMLLYRFKKVKEVVDAEVA